LELAVKITAAAKEASTTAQEAKAYTPLLHLYLFFLFMFQILFWLSDNALDVLLRFLAMFFRSLGQRVTALPTSILTLSLLVFTRLERWLEVKGTHLKGMYVA